MAMSTSPGLRPIVPQDCASAMSAATTPASLSLHNVLDLVPGRTRGDVRRAETEQDSDHDQRHRWSASTGSTSPGFAHQSND